MKDGKNTRQTNNSIDICAEFECIFGCSREEALADKSLVDVTKYAKKHGIKVPVAMTREVYSLVVEQELVEVIIGKKMAHLLHTLYMQIKEKEVMTNKIYFEVIGRKGEGARLTIHKIMSLISLSEEGEIVMTIMFPEED